MREHTVAERDILKDPEVELHVRLFVPEPTGTPGTVDDYVLMDISLIGGNHQKVISADWGEHQDNPVGDATIVIHTSQGSDSLNPLITDSVPNTNTRGILIRPGIPIYMETAVTAPGVAPVSGDWKRVFWGRVDKVEIAEDELTLSCRDWGGVLMDRFLETAGVYGDPAGQLSEEVMQEIMDDVGIFDDIVGAPAVIVLEDGVTDSDFAIIEYGQDRGPLLEILRTIAEQKGWDIRYRWIYKASLSAETYVLVYRDPDRNKTVADATFTDAEYFDIKGLSVDIANIRNVVKLFYGDNANAVYEDTVSIGKYGRRFMEIPFGYAKNIDTLAESDILGAAIISDLAEPYADKQVTMRYFWPVQLNDLYEFVANDIFYSDNLKVAVIAYRHHLEDGDIETTLTCRGKPAGAVRNWTQPKPPNPIIVRDTDASGEARENTIWVKVTTV